MTDRMTVANGMVCALAARIRDGDVVGVGLGTPLALAAALLAKATHAPESHVVAAGTFDARVDLPGYMMGVKGLEGRTPAYVSHFESMDMAERQTMSLQFLRPAQIDGHGNLNTSRIGGITRPATRFPGGLATADVPTLLPRVIAYVPDHRLRNVVDQVAYATACGEGWSGPRFPTSGVVALITNLCVFTFRPNGARLETLHPWATVRDVEASTGFFFTHDADSIATVQPTYEQLEALSYIDPDGLRLSEIRADRSRLTESQRSST